MKLLAIDPSVNHCGIAIIDGGEYQHSYTFRSDTKKTIEQRLKDLAYHFADIGRRFDQAIIELPSSFIREGIYGLKNIRDVQVLHIAIGAIIGGLSIYPDLKIEFVKVEEWKGKTSKEQTQFYAKSLTGKDLNTHEADAYVMGIKWLSQLRFKRAVKEATLKSDGIDPTKRRFLRT